ncbi:MAG TPA: glycosyltransferase family A protein [Acidobacteriaceae bacterium]|jgi:glycosyltransferase involved in cell wall biosynthesis|nr:glycosyltransferase family A protein [Acidobacteriaceae bacterium]
MSSQDFVLITAAHNEAAYIETTIRSIVEQTLRPLRWIIVSDASTDATDAIVRSWAEQHPFIELLRVDRAPEFSFAGKANAIALAWERLKGLDFGFIGILDADVAFDPDYYQRLLLEFQQDPALGLSGGFIHETVDGVFVPRTGNRTWSVAGATQLFRRPCFEAIGGIQPMQFGGEDWRAEVSARMLGYTVRANPDLRAFHYRHTGNARNPYRYAFRQGRMDHAIGGYPPFVILKCVGRMRSPRTSLLALARIGGFLWSSTAGPARPVSPDFVRFLRREQRARLLGRGDSLERNLHPKSSLQ